MGLCLSILSSPKQNLIENTDGNEKDYNFNFLEDRVLGEGEFGVVKLVHPLVSGKEMKPMAVKILQKGIVFKDNTLYSPIFAKNLKLEVAILRKLAGDHFILKLNHIYESRTKIFLLTELCEGGELIQWVSNSKTDLKVKDVSRISYQIIDAIAHCARNGVIHRDIKPENILFQHQGLHSDLRLIDFGSSTMDNANPVCKTNVESSDVSPCDVDIDFHEHDTFAGSAFYISPEMFKRKYDCKTDVWSVGVTLYVLVAGYPADSLQAAFDFLHKSDRNLQELPNMPKDLPDSFFDLLTKLLTYSYVDRVSATNVVDDTFINLHKEKEEKKKNVFGVLSGMISGKAKSEADNPIIGKTLKENNIDDELDTSETLNSYVTGSVNRHVFYLGYQKFERSVTTLFATMLTREEYDELIDRIAKKVTHTNLMENEKRLQVVKVKVLKQTLTSLKFTTVRSMMENLPNASTYDNFAYRTNLLRLFIQVEGKSIAQMSNSTHAYSNTGGKLKSSSMHRSSSSGGLDSSSHGYKPSAIAFSHSVHGNNVWESWNRKRGRGTDALGSSRH